MKHLYCFNNKVKTFIDTNSLPNGINLNNLDSLNNRYVLYKIVVPNGMVYIGYTHDLGQRMTTHNKCARNIDRKLYNDIRRYGECTFEILGVYRNKEDAQEREKELIDEYKYKLLYSRYGKTLPLVDKEERNYFLFDKIYNIKS